MRFARPWTARVRRWQQERFPLVKKYSVTVPFVGIVSGTRALAGLGLGLLLAGKLNDDQRRSAGWTLLGVGVVTTIPLVLMLFDWEVPESEVR